MWKTINDVLNRCKKSKDIEHILLNNETHITDPAQIAEEFNDYFNKIPNVTQARLSAPINNYINLIPYNTESIFLLPTNSVEVEKVIGSLNNKSNSSLPSKFVKLELSVLLSELFNMCLISGIYPDSLKVAKIVPIFKSGNIRNVSNYRPISLLPIINKIFEKLLYARLQSFFEGGNLISENQFGFRRARDTSQAALRLIDEILPSMGTKECSAAVFLDFSKAFDTVDHSILLMKLERYGVRGCALDLLKSYLSDRSHCVRIGECVSPPLLSRVGVPQGSCLGPLLYLMYANDLNYLLPNVPLILFADDTTLVETNVNPNLLLFLINTYLDKIYDWCCYNKLAVNTDKTKWILFSRNRGEIPKLLLNNVEIERVKKLKYLGFTLDDRLTYKYHVKGLISNLASYAFVSWKIRPFMTVESAKLYYYGLVHSRVCYGLLLWGGVFLEGMSAIRLCRLQDKIIFNLFACDNDTRCNVKDIYKRHNILQFPDLYKVKLCICTFKILKENYAPFLGESLESCARDIHYDMRHVDEYIVPFPTVRSVKFNFLYRSIKLWNELPVAFKELPDSKIFGKSLFKNYIDQY
jgi:hypothetical protein